MERFIAWLKDSWGYLLLTLAGCEAIWRAVDLYGKFSAPAKAKKKAHEEKEADTDRRLSELEKHDEKDLGRFAEMSEELKEIQEGIKRDMDQRFEKQEKTNQTLLLSLLSITNHMIDGNGIDELKKSRDALNSAIIQRDKP